MAVTAFLVHLAIWRIHLPRRQTKALLVTFFSVLILFIAIFYLNPDNYLLGIRIPKSTPEFLHIVLFFISITLSYMITYSALEADSPSLVIVMEIGRSGTDGLPVDSFKKAMTDDILVIPRINDLLRDELAFIDNGRYKLTKKGRLFVAIFSNYRKILKLSIKGG